MIVELLSVGALLAGGCATLRAGGLRGWAVLPLGFLAGICLFLAVGLVQVITPLPTTPVLTLAVTAGAPVGWWLTRLRRGADVAVPVGPALLVVASLAAAVALLRAANLVKWHTDSLRYLMAGKLLADGTYPTAMSTHDLIKRLIGVPLLHAPAHLGGEYYLPSVTALLAAATVAALVWFFREGMHGVLAAPHLATLTLLGVLLLVTGNRFVFSAFYVNGHLLTGALVMCVAGCGWLLAGTGRYGADGADGGARALRWLQLLAVPALVVTRPEGPVFAGLALLPTLLSATIATRHRRAALAVLGAAVVGWNGFMVWLHNERGAEMPPSVGGMVLAGLLLFALIPILTTRPATAALRHRTRMLWLAEAGLWLALAAFTVRRPDILRDSVDATIQNVVRGSGKWGLSLVALAVLVLGAVLLARSPALTYLRFPVTTFLPVGFLLAYLREEGAYRVGYGDSLSRMFMQVVPVAVLYVLAAAAVHTARGSAPGSLTAGRARFGGVARGGVGLGGVGPGGGAGAGPPPGDGRRYPGADQIHEDEDHPGHDGDRRGDAGRAQAGGRGHEDRLPDPDPARGGDHEEADDPGEHGREDQVTDVRH
jgi:hypothetical protein